VIDSRFLRACMLQLLDEQPTYGYELLARLRASGWSLEAGRGYRVLRAMEAEGLLGSEWCDSSHGPRRRAYNLTPAGREALQTLINEARGACALLSTFIARAA
jgi:PadR family transcriptional regulator PadR